MSLKSTIKSIGTGIKTFAQTGSLKSALHPVKSGALTAPVTQQGLSTIQQGNAGQFSVPKSTFGVPRPRQLDSQMSALNNASAVGGLINHQWVPGGHASTYARSDQGALDRLTGVNNYKPGAIGSSQNFNTPLTAGGTTQDSYRGTPGVSTTSYSTPHTANAGYTGSPIQKQKAALDATSSAIAVQKDNSTTPEEMDYWDKQQKKIQRQMDRLMEATSDETNTQAQIDALANDERLVQAGLAQKTTDVNAEPIPLQYLQGWGTTFNKQADAKIQAIAAERVPLEVRLANLQQKRQSALDIVKSQYDEAKARAKENRQRQYDLQDYATRRKDTLSDRAYSSRSSGFKYTAQDQAEDSKALEASRGTDGWVDPTIYQTLYNEWVKAGGTLSAFKSKYPPKDYVNPANTWLPDYLKNASSSQTA